MRGGRTFEVPAASRSLERAVRRDGARQMKILLAQLCGGAGDVPILDASLALARHLGGHVRALFLAPDPRTMIPFMGENVPGSLVEEIYRRAEMDVEAARAAAHARFDTWQQDGAIEVSSQPGAPGPSAEWNVEVGDDREAISRAGRLADLVIVARPTSVNDVRARAAAEAAIFNTGCPVLLVPPTGKLNLGGACVIGWQGSREAARALGAAVPLLGAAESIHIVSVLEGKSGRIPPAEAQSYLAWHGLKSYVTVCEPTASVAATLFRKAHSVDAGLVIMGAYSHTRFRELVFGGVTEYAMTRAEVPVLLCH